MRNVLCFAMLVLLTTNLNAQKQGNEMKEMKPVLIVIDTQNRFMHLMDENDTKIAIYMINWAISSFRELGLPIIKVYHTDPIYGPVKDSEEFQFDERIQVRDEDPMIIKNYPNAFKKTELDKMLKDMGANTLFLCGLSSIGCVIATYHGAKDNDYDVMLLKDALMSHDATLTDYIERIFNTVNYDAMLTMMKYSKNDEKK